MEVPVLLPLLSSTLALASPGSADWVQADVLHLRAAPDAGAASLARLPYATWVRVEEEKGSWARVTVGDRPREAELVGWVDKAYLAPTVAGRDLLLAQAQEAATPADAVRPLTRALALDPGDPDAIVLLSTVAAQLGDTSLQRRADRLSRGRDPVYLGTCLEGRVVVHSSLVPATGAVTTVGAPDVNDAAGVGVLKALGAELGGVSWFAHTPEASRVPPGRFARPFVDARHGERAEPWGPGPFDSLVIPPGVLVLGACDDEGGVYATVPLTVVPEVHLPPSMAAVALTGLATLDASDSTSITLSSWEGLPFLEARVGVPYVFRDCGGEVSAPETVETWWLLDEAGRVVRRWGAGLPPEPEGGTPFATYPVAWWVAIDLPEVSIVFSVGSGESAMESGVSVQAFPAGAPGPARHVVLRSAGC